MKLSSKVNKLMKHVMDKENSRSTTDLEKRRQEANSRGMMYCSDGIERTPEDWVDFMVNVRKRLSPEVGEFVKRLIHGEVDDEQNNGPDKWNY